MMFENISLYISLGSFLFGGGFLVTVYKNLKTTQQNLKTIQLGLQAMLRDRLLQAHHHYKEVGHISYQEMQNLLNMYEMYHSLGANGVMDEIIAEIKDIPIKG